VWLFNFDSLIYRPEKLYSDYGPGIERFGDWAYNHK